tara:strand:- start:772 stop:1014 length:243 start_codon:yes stop_codon:yes gene_type:complete
MKEHVEPWVARLMPLVLVLVAGVVWSVRLEGKIEHHHALPYHSGTQSAKDDLIAIKVELRWLREEMGEIKTTLEKLREPQ